MESIEENNTRDLIKDAYELVNRTINRQQNLEIKYGAVSERLKCMRDLAVLLGDNTLTSFVRSLETLDRFKAQISWDGSMFSLGWVGGGLVGGLIFHAGTREFSVHT